MAMALAAAALVLAASAFALSVATWRPRVDPADGSDLPADVHGLRQEVAALRAEVRDGLRHLGVVRYDAYDDLGGRMSWSLALLDDAGNGVVLTSIHGRSDARTYVRSVAGWKSEHELSAEEREAVTAARP
ncbi:MAG: DUF4446 family protein [Nocardioides sp.]